MTENNRSIDQISTICVFRGFSLWDRVCVCVREGRSEAHAKTKSLWFASLLHLLITSGRCAGKATKPSRVSAAHTDDHSLFLWQTPLIGALLSYMNSTLCCHRWRLSHEIVCVCMCHTRILAKTCRRMEDTNTVPVTWLGNWLNRILFDMLTMIIQYNSK